MPRKRFRLFAKKPSYHPRGSAPGKFAPQGKLRFAEAKRKKIRKRPK